MGRAWCGAWHVRKKQRCVRRKAPPLAGCITCISRSDGNVHFYYRAWPLQRRRLSNDVASPTTSPLQRRTHAGSEAHGYRWRDDFHWETHAGLHEPADRSIRAPRRCYTGSRSSSLCARCYSLVSRRASPPQAATRSSCGASSSALSPSACTCSSSPTL